MLKRIKYWLSFFTDISLETSFSEYNPHLEVLLVSGRHQLVTEDAIYSFEDKYENFYDAFKGINWKKFQAKNVLVLGLGLGSVIYMLEKNFNKILEYKAVEIDPEIIRMAHSYCLNNLNSYVEVVETDALNFVNICQDKFDLVLMDVFQSSKVPSAFQTSEFIRALHSLLKQNGLLIYNRMHLSLEDKSENESFKENFNKVFPYYQTLSVKDNLVYFSDAKFLA